MTFRFARNGSPFCFVCALSIRITSIDIVVSASRTYLQHYPPRFSFSMQKDLMRHLNCVLHKVFFLTFEYIFRDEYQNVKYVSA
jgi:hypothetical protein